LALLLMAAALFFRVVDVPARDAAATVSGGSFRDCPTCPEMVRIAPGTFAMGSTEAETTLAKLQPERASPERPQHTVTIAKAFAIGRYELTIGEFAAYVRDRGFTPAKGCFGLLNKSWHHDPEGSWDKKAGTSRHAIRRSASAPPTTTAMSSGSPGRPGMSTGFRRKRSGSMPPGRVFAR